jgi:hypothetical protein
MLVFLDTLIGFTVVMLAISLLITILNQIASSLLAHRGSNLCWGLGELFRQLDPKWSGFPMLASQAQLMAETILTHPLISDSTFSTAWARLVAKYPRLLRVVRRWQFANGIRPDELAAVLSQIVKVRPARMSVGLHVALSGEISKLLQSPSTMAVRQGALTTAIAAGVAPGLVPQAVGVTTIAAGILEDWFGKIMDRVTQRFTMWMRIWTVVFSFLIAGLGCVDAFAIVSTLYSNSAVRAQLVNTAPQISDIAKRTIPEGSVSKEDAVSKGVVQMYTNALNQAAKAVKPTAPAPSNIESAAAGRTWITANFAKASEQDAVWAAFEANWRDEMKTRAEAAKQVVSILSVTGLPSFGIKGWSAPGSFYLRFLGVLLAALLLSLGAPFWYNTLASVTSLRPLLAGQPSSQKDKSTK